MCGILGTLNYKISPEFFLQQLNLLQHRGPDGYGVWQNKEGTAGWL
jgi:asparagine synthase (glutamine-hydrolysing)